MFVGDGVNDSPVLA